LYIVGRSLAQGRGAGVVSALGVSTGGAVHALCGALGVTTLLAASQHGLVILKYCGAAYLVFVGLRMIFSKPDDNGSSLEESKSVPKEARLRTVYLQGLLTNLLNPKVALFFMAFIPQFIGETANAKSLTFLLLSSFFLVTGTVWCIGLALVASLVRNRFLLSSRFAQILNWLGGGMLVFLGVRLAKARIGN